MPDDLFTPAGTPVVPVTPVVTDPVTPNPASPTPASGSAIDQLVGQGKKFATIEDLATGKLHSDGHIETLTAELASLREDLNGRLNAQEILKELKEIQLKSNESQPVATLPVLDEGKIAELVKSTVTDMDVEGRKTINRLAVSERLTKEWGGLEASKVMLSQKAAELGVTVEFLSGVVESSPNAFYQLVGLTGAKTVVQNTPGPGDVVNKGVGTGPDGSPDGLVGATENDWSWWQNMRRTNPKQYHSGEMARRRHELVTADKLVLPTKR